MSALPARIVVAGKKAAQMELTAPPVVAPPPVFKLTMAVAPMKADFDELLVRLAELGVGVAPIAPKKLTPARLAAALRTLTQDSTMRQRAAELGALLRAEDGLAATCELVQRYVTEQYT